MFDPVFGLGYGEENDLCMRAAAAGFRNVLCEEAFVLHLGGSSFGDKPADLAERNMQILLERHPQYLDLVRAYIAADPTRPLRELALSQYRVLSQQVPGVLHVIHGHGGGTEYHVRALIAASAAVFRHYLLIAVGDEWQLEEHAADDVRTYDFTRLTAEPWSDFLGGICARFDVDLIHFHNISGCRDGLLPGTSPPRYALRLYGARPRLCLPDDNLSQCAAPLLRRRDSAPVCAACLAAQPDFADADIVAWRAKHREVLARASFLIAPSVWAASILNKYFPEHEVTVIPHGNTAGMSRSDVIARRSLADDGRPVVAVLGAIGPNKGARRLERLVELTRERGLAVRWVLIGYLDRGREPFQSADAEALNALDKKAAAIGGEGRSDASSPGLPGGTIDMREPNLTRLNNGFSSLLEHMQSADVAPTVPMVTAATELQKVLTKLLADWNQFKTKDVAAINEQLRAANQPLLNP